jgi:tetratricopeptide (TPR) repeat protein
VKKIQKPRRSRETPPAAARQHFARKIVSLVWSRHGRRLLLLWALALAAYSNSFHGGIFFDNIPALLEDPRIRAVTAQNVGAILTEGYWHIAPNSGLYRPVTTLSYLVNYAVFDNGANPAGYHWFNFVLHGVNVSLVYALGILIFDAPALALAFAAIWGLHPLLTESVTNIIGRAELLAAFGVLAGLLCYVRWASATGRRKHWWLAAMVAAQAVGLFSKESAAILPAILLVYDLTWSERASWRARAPAYAALLLPFAAFLYLRIQLHTSIMSAVSKNLANAAGFWTARVRILKIIEKSIQLFVWPDHLSPDYSYNAIPGFRWKLLTWEDGRVLIVLAVCLCAIAFAVRCRRRWKAMFFFVTFFFVAFAPTAVAVGVLGERFLYLPSVGLAGCLVAAIYELGRRFSSSWPASPRVAWIAMGVACLALAVRTYARNSDWHDELSLWSSAVNVVPGDARAHLNLGTALEKIPGRLPDAIAELQTALRIMPGNAKEHSTLGGALAKMPGRVPDAIAEFQAALRIQPNDASVHYNLGRLLARMPGQLPDAIAEFQAALRIQPDFAEAHNNLGNAFERMPGRLTDAMAEWQAAVRSDPDLGEAHYRLGNAFSKIPGSLPDAIAEYQAALHSQPRFAQLHNNLGNAFARTPGRMTDAIQEWRAAVRLQPKLVQAHANLGRALAHVEGQLPSAIAELEEAQKLEPDPRVQQLLDQLRKGQ